MNVLYQNSLECGSFQCVLCLKKEKDSFKLNILYKYDKYILKPDCGSMNHSFTNVIVIFWQNFVSFLVLNFKKMNNNEEERAVIVYVLPACTDSC